MIDFRRYSPTQSTQEVINKIEGMDVIQNFIKSIYEKKVNFFEISQFVKFLSFQVGYGTVYSTIRENLQNICKIHRKLILESQKSFNNVYNNICLITTPPSQESKEQLRFIKQYQTICINIYYHFSTISESNKQICQLWELMKQKQAFIKTENDRNIRTPELKLSTLNLLTLKQIIPCSEYINLNNFQEILTRLNNSRFLYESKKKQIRQMIMVLAYKQFNISKLLDQANIEMCQQKLTQPIHWLEKLKSQPIGKKLSSILDEKFGKKIIQQQLIDEKTLADLQKGLLPDKIFTLGASLLSSFKFRVITDQQLSEKQQNDEKDDEIQVIQLIPNIENSQKKKKKKNKKKNKNKKKKIKSVNSEQQQLKNQSPDKTIDVQQKQKVTIDKNCQQIINFLREMKIDDTERTTCTGLDGLQKWKILKQKIVSN